jgi:2-polyprenyl-3-methyl-5-hydroxy-6-metoxy-1,4-benzoquinol methylase
MLLDVQGGVIVGIKTAKSNEEMVTTYQKKIQEFGFDGRTLLYPEDRYHEAKIKQHCKILSKLVDSGDSLLDIGCGYGSLVNWLKGPLLEDCKYHGIDIVPEFIAEATKRHGSANATFEERALEEYSGDADWCILLGVVNSVPNPVRLVQLAWDKSKKGLIVDFNDVNKIDTKYNNFIIKLQIDSFYEMGAKKVSKYAEEGFGWTILTAKKY